MAGEQVIFSNSDLLKSRVRNLKRMVERRSLFSIGVTYDTPPDTVARIPEMIRDIITTIPHTRFERAHFARFLDSSLEFEIVYYVTSSDYAIYVDTQQAVNLGLLRRFNDVGIQFAFPTQTVIHVGDATRAGAELLRPVVGEISPG